MRLSDYEVKTISETFLDLFKSGDIYLFGSRVDDSKKGGDIDLYIRVNYLMDAKERLQMQTKFKMQLEDKIGEQKIDIIISKDTSRPIEQEALQKGIKL